MTTSERIHIDEGVFLWSELTTTALTCDSWDQMMDLLYQRLLSERSQRSLRVAVAMGVAAYAVAIQEFMGKEKAQAHHAFVAQKAAEAEYLPDWEEEENE